MATDGHPAGMVLLVRAMQLPTAALVASLQHAIRSVADGVLLLRIATLDALWLESFSSPQILLLLVGAFAVLGVLVAITGVYGVMSFLVAQRTREFGVCLALGATPRQILGSLVADSFKLSLLGSGIGLACALALSRLVQGMLFEVGPLDPMTYLVAPSVISLIAVLAAFAPARQVLRLNPAAILRTEKNRLCPALHGTLRSTRLVRWKSTRASFLLEPSSAMLRLFWKMFAPRFSLVGCWLLSFLVATPLLAQSAVHLISGTVFDPQGFAVPGATVRLLGANRVLLREVLTDESGRFSLEGVTAGRYELRIEASGFSVFQRVLDVPRDTERELAVPLQLTPVELEVTVTGRHGAPEEVLVEPATVRIRDLRQLAIREPAHLPRMFSEEAGILQQETTPGQGSPILRGQGAQTVLYLIDGLRYNNSIYRSGNTQYLGWVPASSTDAVEVFLGPASAQYGSDALGGAINVMTAALPPWTARGVRWSTELETLFTSADLAGGTSLRAGGAGTRWSASLIGSFRRHQGLRAGGGEDSHNVLRRFFELSPVQVRQILGSRMIDTDFAQSSWSSKFGVQLDAQQFLTFAWIQSEQFGIRRYDRLLGGEGRLLHNFGPQRLGFGYVRYQRLDAGALRSLEATFSINRQTDGQTTQTRPTSPRENEISRVTALGYRLATAWAPVARHALTAGGEFYDEFVFGRAFALEPGGVPEPIRPRFPNGTRYQSLGLYVSDDWEALPQKLFFEAGTRFSYFRYRSFAGKNVFVDGRPTVPDATETFTDLTFNAGASYFLRPELVLFGRTARGFRAPTVFDLGEQGITGGGFEVSPSEAVRLGAEVGDSASRDARSTGLPWQPLEPEVLWSFEGGLRWRWERVSGDVTWFDSEFFDAIQRRVLIVPVNVVGQTVGDEPIIAQDDVGRIFVAADFRPVVSRANIGRVRIWGVESTLRLNWTRQWSSTLRHSAHRGRELDTGNFARRIAPDFFFASLRWTDARGRLWLETFTEVSGPQTRLNPAELDDPRIGARRTAAQITDFFNNGAQRLGLIRNGLLTVTGETLAQVLDRVLGPAREPAPLFTRTEGFATLNFRGGVRLGESNELSFALLNLTDANYRRHGSGVDAPGINVTFSYRIRFLP